MQNSNAHDARHKLVPAPVLVRARLRRIEYVRPPLRRRSITDAILTLDVTLLDSDDSESSTTTTVVLRCCPLSVRIWQRVRSMLRRRGYIVYRDRENGPTWWREVRNAHDEMIVRERIAARRGEGAK